MPQPCGVLGGALDNRLCPASQWGMAKLTDFFSSPALPVPDSGLAIVTGATSGIGEATARALAERGGFRVIGTSRDASNVAAPIPGVEYLSLDLSDPASIEAFATEVLALGTPAVLINNAGESQSGPLEELPREALERLFQVNVIGHIDLTQRLLPAMRAAGQGRVVMVGSMLASFPLAFRSSYVASKAAIKGFAFACRRELAPFGVGVSVMEPGSINTGLSARRTKYVDDSGPYGKEFATMLAKLDKNESNGISSEAVAEVILNAVFDERPAPLYAKGSMAEVVFPLSRVLSREVLHKLINRKHGL